MRAVACFKPDGTHTDYNSIFEASQLTGLSRLLIGKCARGQIKLYPSRLGWQWKTITYDDRGKKHYGK